MRVHDLLRKDAPFDQRFETAWLGLAQSGVCGVMWPVPERYASVQVDAWQETLP